MTSLFQPPYFAVIFTSTHHQLDNNYVGLDDRLMEQANKIDGFLGMDSARSGLGISVSYWKDLESIRTWRQDAEHILAIENGISKWYESYSVRVCKVEREYEFHRS
jgi:heme-degrading monooxygenase HmoA